MFVHNTWYVAAWDHEVGRHLMARKILNIPVVLYRTAAGAPVALEDTCPHRFAPLHRGKIFGDTIECPYHGLRFDAQGACVHNPFDPKVTLRAARIRSYPVVERDRFIWVWMGEADKADAATIPALPWLNQTDLYTMSGEQIMHQPLNYELILDNLMDLSHGQFVHRTTLGNDSIATGTLKTWQDGDRIYSNRWNPDGEAPLLFTLPKVVPEGTRVDYWNDMRWDPPGVYYLEVGVTRTGEPRDAGAFLGSVHMLTPVDETSTVYRYILFRTFAPGDDGITQAMEALAKQAFTQEDEPMILAVQERMAGRDFWAMEPLSLKSDKAGILVRRTLQRLCRESEDV